MKQRCSKFLILCLMGVSRAVFADSGDLVECAQKAITSAGLTSDQAVKLCVNGGTVKSVDCATSAMREAMLSADQAVELCANKALKLENMVKFVQ